MVDALTAALKKLGKDEAVRAVVLVGAGNYGMCGRAYGPRFLWTWPNARISVMGGEQAANVLAQVKREQLEKSGAAWSESDEDAYKAPILAQYEKQSSAYYATARLWDDGIIDPKRTRQVLAFGLAVASGAETQVTKFGVFRM
jgi:3-methylcrotonyl-CoA carboxylase beta subunit